MIEQFEDKHIGTVYIKRNVRAKKVIARRKESFIELTVPYGLSGKEIVDIFNRIKPKLSTLKANPSIFFNENTSFRTMSFLLKIENKNVKNYYTELKEGMLTIICPHIADFADSKVQKIIRNAVERGMRFEAERIFPDKLKRLAEKHGFNYNSLKINKSRSRWGSCSSKKNINLSYFCFLLPEYLIDFVILHELCHTKEMNHGTEFWRLLDSVTEGRARVLTSELKTSAHIW